MLASSCLGFGFWLNVPPILSINNCGDGLLGYPEFLTEFFYVASHRRTIPSPYFQNLNFRKFCLVGLFSAMRIGSPPGVHISIILTDRSEGQVLGVHASGSVATMQNCAAMNINPGIGDIEREAVCVHHPPVLSTPSDYSVALVIYGCRPQPASVTIRLIHLCQETEFNWFSHDPIIQH